VVLREIDFLLKIFADGFGCLSTLWRLVNRYASNV